VKELHARTKMYLFHISLYGQIIIEWGGNVTKSTYNDGRGGGHGGGSG